MFQYFSYVYATSHSQNYGVALNRVWNDTSHANDAPTSTGEKLVSTVKATEHPKPQQSLTTITNATQVEGQVLETLAGISDGRSVTVSSGTYTFPNITAIFTGDMHSSPIDIEGSKINYKPPHKNYKN